MEKDTGITGGTDKQEPRNDLYCLILRVVVGAAAVKGLRSFTNLPKGDLEDFR
jgi:hypothetical protein